MTHSPEAPAPSSALTTGAPAPSAPEKEKTNREEPKRSPAADLGKALAALGVVYGDIGTSPLYALQASVGSVTKISHSIDLLEIMGLASMIFWALMLVVTVKYVTLVMQAGFNGEGGIIALMSLAQKAARTPQVKWGLGLIGIGGCCLFFGDSVITPAISVLSAVEGLEVSFPEAAYVIIPVAIAILIGIFSVQALGTGRIGRAFGPIMVVWFLTIATLGIRGITFHPTIVRALLPYYAVHFAILHPYLAFIALGSVVLAVTGAEALYADMGHFGRRPIRMVWLLFVFPALTLNYLGQAALIAHDPRALANPFYHLAPAWAQIPLLVLATFATIIASQAGISGSFSLCRQLIQLGYLPRARIVHTNSLEEAQIYLPSMNWMLAFGALMLVLGFHSAEALAGAYGIAVTGTFICTTLLCLVVFNRIFLWKILATYLIFGFFLILDLLFCVANLLKIEYGGWVPLSVAILCVLGMTTWERGRQLLNSRREADSIPMASFLVRLPQSKTITKVPGIAVYLSSDPKIVPNALLHNLRHNHVLHDLVLFVTVITLNQPEADPADRLDVRELTPGIYRILVRYGYMEMPNLPRALAMLTTKGIKFDPIQATYFISYELAFRSKVSKMPLWRQWIFLYLLNNAGAIENYFRIPPERAVEFGVRIGI